eukprot:5442552-Alexandrium_andersonii.AAC.1
MSAWAMRYRNEHTKVRRALARLQRVGEEEEAKPPAQEPADAESDEVIDGGSDGWWGRQGSWSSWGSWPWGQPAGRRWPSAAA